jgi:hypothetical protein
MQQVTSRVFSYDYKRFASLERIPLTDPVQNKDGITFRPGLDLVNHSNDPNLMKAGVKFDLEASDPTASIVAGRNFTAGEEVVWNYGEKDNIALLSFYGFVI